MYRERASGLAGAVVWERTGLAEVSTQRVLPDGCLDLIWGDGTLLVAGPDTTAFLATAAPGTAFAGLRFAPGIGPTLFGVPGSELRNRRVPLADLWPGPDVRRLTEQVAAATDPGVELERIAAGRLDRNGAPDSVTAGIVGQLRSGRSVSATAEAVGLGQRRMHRHCLTAFGYGPKMLARILRMTRAVAMARAGTPFATVAAVGGYSDQAHLSREVKALAGVPLGQLVS